MAKWKLLKERGSLRGVVEFFDTGQVFEAADAAAAHEVVIARQAQDGISYGAIPAQGGMSEGLLRLAKAIATSVRL